MSTATVGGLCCIVESFVSFFKCCKRSARALQTETKFRILDIIDPDWR